MATDSSTSPDRRRAFVSHVILALLCVLYLLLYMDRVNLSVAAGAIKAQFHLTATQLGLAFSAFGYGYVLLQILGGTIGDRIGARRTLGGFLLLWGVAAMAIGFVNSLATLIGTRIVLGMAEGTALPTATRALASWLPVSRRGFAQGLMQGCSRLGTAIGVPIIAAIMALSGTWRSSFWLLGALGLVWAAVWIWFYRDQAKAHPFLQQGGATASMVKPAAVSQPTPWRPLLRRMAPTIGVWFCQGWTFWMFLSWIPIFLLTQYKIDLKSSALFTAGVFLAGVAGDLTGGLLSDWILRRTGNVTHARQSIVAAAFLGTACFVAPIIFVRHEVTLIALCLSGALFSLELMTGPMWAVPMDIAPDHAGTAAGMMNTGSAVASILTPMVFGIVVDATGNWNAPFIGSFVFLLLGAFLSTRIRPERQIRAAAKGSLSFELSTSGQASSATGPTTASSRRP
jgi:MFS family permease